jgi:hypothetical protein
LHLGHGTGEPQVIALAVSNLAELAVNLGDLDRADALSTEALMRARQVGFRSTIASALHTRIEIPLHAAISRAPIHSSKKRSP